MEDIRYIPMEKLCIDKVGYISIVRSKDYTFNVKKGKEVYSFVYVENGSIEYIFGEKYGSVRVNKGELAFVPKQIPYTAVYLCENTHIKLISFDTYDYLPFHNAPVVRKSAEISNIFSENRPEERQNFLLICANISKLMYILSEEESEVPKIYKKILPVVKNIENNYFENHKVSYYAAMTNMSESNFRRLFKEYTGKSVIEYRNEIRLREVNKMLISGEYNVGEAAIAAGFNNMSFFYEQYRKYNKIN